MKVQSPVGTFPVRVRGVRVARSGVRVDASMGAWRSSVSLERADLPLLVGAGSSLLAAFLAGAWAASRR